MTMICSICGSSDHSIFCTAEDRLQIRPGVVYEVWCCSACGYGWTEPSPADEELAEFYPPTYLGDFEKVIEEYLSGRLAGTSSWKMETEKAELVEKYVQSGRLLDIGCGEGKFLWSLDPKRWQRVGIDLNQPLIEAARNKIPDLDLHVGTIDDEVLEEEGYDVITFWHALEHIPDPSRALARTARLLRPGGLAFISLPKVESLQAQWFRRHWYAFGDVPRHLHHFSSTSLKLLLSQVGLAFIEEVFFSKAVNFHCWKHSMRSWSRERFRSQLPYILFKPALHLLPLLEALTGRQGVSTLIARKGESRGTLETFSPDSV